MTPANFQVTVPELGTLTVRHRNIRDQLLIEGRADRLLGGPVQDTSLRNTALSIAMLPTLVVDWPDGFALDDVDPLDQDAVSRVLRAAAEVRAAEERFRGRAKPAGEAVGPGAGANGGVAVPAALPAGTD